VGAREAGPTAGLAASAVGVAGPRLRDPGERRFDTTSSCDVCGKGALEEVAVEAPKLPDVASVSRERVSCSPAPGAGAGLAPAWWLQAAEDRDSESAAGWVMALPATTRRRTGSTTRTREAYHGGRRPRPGRAVGMEAPATTEDVAGEPSRVTGRGAR
jgi:hypothetical protein